MPARRLALAPFAAAAAVASAFACEPGSPDAPTGRDGRVVLESPSPAVGGDRLVEAIAIETGRGELAPILEPGCAIPCRETVTFGTAEPEQTEILLYLYRGNGPSTEGAAALGVYEISGFPLTSGAEIEVRATFVADRDGIGLEVEPGSEGTIRVSRLDEPTSLDWSTLASEHPRLAPERTFTARDGTPLPLRSYGESGPVDLVLVHGSGAFNVYLSGIAAAIADAGAAVVHTPDLRGHGAAPARRGDIDYVDQLEDDLADLLAELRRLHPERKRVVGGHSSGGGLAVRFAGGAHAADADAYLLLAPYLGHDAPTTRPDSGGWAKPKPGRIVALSLLNALGVDAWNDTTVLEFDLPPSRRSGLETPSYTFRMMAGINPRDHRSDLGALCAPALVVVGGDDEAMVAEAYAPLFSELAPTAEVVVLQGASHLGLVSEAETAQLATDWLRRLAAGELAGRCR